MGSWLRVIAFILTLKLSIITHQAVAFAGAWTLPKGEGQIISTTTRSKAKNAFDVDRSQGARVDFAKLDQAVYIEYGVRENLTLVGSGALQDIRYISRDGLQSYSGLGTSRIGLRYKFTTQGTWVYSIQPSFVIPDGGETVPDADLGRGGYGAEIRVLAGRNLKFFEKPAFLDLQASLDYRTGAAPEQLSFDGTLGVKVMGDVQMIGQAFAQYTTRGQFGPDVVLENDSLKLQTSIVYPLRRAQKDKQAGDDDIQPKRSVTKRSLQFGVFQTVWGRSTVKQSGVFVGLWERF